MSAYAFISYKHGDPSTAIAKRLHTHLRLMATARGVKLYLDDKDNVGGDQWSQNVETALDACTHFIALLGTDYWLSEQCQRELNHALRRYEQGGVPKILFVKAEEIATEYFVFDRSSPETAVKTDNPRLNKVTDLHFLGPFNQNVQLVRLAWEDRPTFESQLVQLVRRFQEVLDRDAAAT